MRLFSNESLANKAHGRHGGTPQRKEGRYYDVIFSTWGKRQSSPGTTL